MVAQVHSTPTHAIVIEEVQTMTYRINVPLSAQEFEALRDASQIQLRHPRDQARYILRSVLLGEPITENNKSVVNSEKNSHNAFATGQP